MNAACFTQVYLLTDNGGLQVDKHSARDVLPSTGLAEKGVGGVVASADGLVGRHLSVRLDSVLEAVQLPASIADLHASLSDVDRYALALWENGANFAEMQHRRLPEPF